MSSEREQQDAKVRQILEPTRTEWGASRWNELKRCRVAHNLQFGLSIVPREQHAAFEIGTLVHACLAHWILGENWREVIDYCSRNPTEWDAFCVEEAERLMNAYELRWGQPLPDGEVLGVEVEYRQYIGGLPYTARLDALIRTPEGEVLIIDHKTRSQARRGDDTVRELQTRSQFLGQSYLTMLEFNLPEPPSVVENAIIKSRVPDFDRTCIPFSQTQIQDWVAAQMCAARSLTNIYDHSTLPTWRNYSACAPDRQLRCQYFQWCHGSEEERTKHYKKENEA